MYSSKAAAERIRAPLGWLGVAFLGIWTYFLAQLFQVYASSFATAANLSLADANDVLRILSNLGQVLFLSGVIAAFWRANLAAGLSSPGVRGLVLGSAGVGVLVLFEVGLLFAWFRVTAAPIRAFIEAYAVGNIVGVALGLAGVASLGVGLSHAVGLFGRAEEERRAAAGSEKTG